MKRIVKRIISWMCVLVMIISMATPVAAVTYNGGTSEGSGANYPIVEAISYRTTSEGYIPSVSKGSAPVEFTLYLKNNGNSTTKEISCVKFTYSDVNGRTLGFKTDKGCNGFDSATYVYYPSLVMNDTTEPTEGTYSLKEFVVTFDDGVSAKYTANEFANGEKIQIKYVSGSTNDFGTIKVAFGEKDCTQKVQVTLDENNPNEKVKVYICGERNLDQIKSVRLFYNYNDNAKLMEGPSGRVTVYDSNTVYYNANFNSDYSTSTYTIARINIETKDNIVYSYYSNEEEERHFSSLNSLDFTNSVPKGMVTLDYFSYINDVLKSKTSTQTANVTNGEATVPIRVSARTVGKGTTLDRVIINFVKRGDSSITFQKEIPGTEFSISNSRYYQTDIKIGADVSPGIYNVASVELVGKTTTGETNTTSYTKGASEGNELTSTMGCNTKLIVKNTDAIVPEETGAASKKSSVTKTSDGKSSAKVSVDNSGVVASGGELDSLGTKFANEKYDFAVESSAIPDGATMEIGKVLTGNTYDIAKEVVKKDSSIASDFRVFEINLLGTGDKKLQPSGDVSISTDIPSGFKNMVVYRIEDGTADKVKVPARIEDGKLVFDTNHFSTYILAQSTSGSGATESNNSSGGTDTSGSGATESDNSSGGAGISGDSEDTGVTENDGDEQNYSDTTLNTLSSNTSSTGAVAVENKLTKDSSGDSVASIKLSSGDKLVGVDVNKLDTQAKAVLNQSFTFDVKAGNGVIPSGTSMKISKVVTGAQYSDAKAVTNTVADKIAVFEIDLLSSSNTKIQPNGKLSITTDIPSGFDASKVAVYRLSTDGKSFTKLLSSVYGGKVTFETDHFSTYMIVQESAEAVAVKAPVTGDNSPLALLVFVLLSAMVTLGVSIKRNFYK